MGHKCDVPRPKPTIGGFVGFASPLRLGRKELSQLVKLVEMSRYVGIGSNAIAGAQAPATAAWIGRAMLGYYGFDSQLASHPAVLTGSHCHDEQTGMEKMMGMMAAALAGHKGVCGLCVS